MISLRPNHSEGRTPDGAQWVGLPWPADYFVNVRHPFPGKDVCKPQCFVPEEWNGRFNSMANAKK